MDLSTHGVVALVRGSNGKYLLLEDSREATLGWWAPPHGSCETTDLSEEAGVIREVKEETDLDVIPIRKVLTQQADTKLKTVSFWLVKTTESSITLNDESSSYGWFTVDEALKLLLYPGTKHFFTMVKEGKISLG